MEKCPERDRLLDAVHRRAALLARMTQPGHPCRQVDNVMAMTVDNLVRTLCVVMGRPFFDAVLGALFDATTEYYGVCRFCHKGHLDAEKEMCQQCWDEGEQLDRELDEQELMDTPSRGQPS
jgi:hypothetical protein